ncbi:MAG TPA: SMP-30/gluconolactonase/LRE family protein [Candidatus Krumholzibacteriaceae bacterium]|nr:SMP-30/gluconolactonase/LRE family protein [Candidatus Krumholzibacteriaceae bacterium]
MKKVVLFLVFILISSCGGDVGGVNKRWAASGEFKTPESVKYDHARNVIYVSNINGSPTARDGNGFVSKLSIRGEVTVPRWITSLNAPKGMAIYEGKLYLADIDEVVEIDIKTGKIMQRYKASAAEFLNDVAADTAGNIYVSDSSSKVSAIYRLRGKDIEVWIKDDKIKNPNGLFIRNGTLFVGSSGDGTLKAVDLETSEISTVAQPGFGIDGLVVDGKGGFILSDWRGKTSGIDRKGELKLLIDTSEAGINSADIDYIAEMNLLLVPTFSDNRVMAYNLDQTGK